MPKRLEAAPGGCQEASPLSTDAYIPCNAPATRLVEHKKEGVFRMCDACANHNIKHRGAVDRGAYDSLADVDLEEVPTEEVAGPSDNEIKSVVEVARRQYALEREVERLEAALKTAKEELREIAEKELPELLVEVGMTSFSLANGARLELKTEVYANVKADDRPTAWAWLDEHGHSDLVKREFLIRFDREDEAWAKRFAGDLERRKRPLNCDVTRRVHPRTLNKWVREALAAGVSFPEELFGVFRKRTSVITLPKTEEKQP